MHRNYFTLLHATQELDRKLRGAELVGIHSQARGEMTCSFTTGEGEELELVIFTRTPQISMFTRKGHHRRKRNSATLWSETAGLGIEAVSMHPADRQIRIDMEGGAWIALQIFAAKTAATLLSAEGKILKTFGRESSPPEAGAAEESIPERLRRMSESQELFMHHLEDNARLGRDPLSGLPGFDRGLQRELGRRTGEERDEKNRFGHFSAIARELLNPSPSVWTDAGGVPKFSILSGTPEAAVPQESVLEGLSAYSMATFSRIGTEGRMKAVRSALEGRLRKIQSELGSMDPAEMEQMARRQESFGHLLIASLFMERTDPGSITVMDIFRADTPDVEIPLQAELSLQENAARYFRKAAKSKNSLVAMEKRRSELLREESEVQESLRRSMEADSPRKTEAFIRAQREKGENAGNIGGGKPEKARNPFKTVRISQTATLLIGRNAAENEQLTFGYAKPDDIWLHARGASGSHCILKGSGPDHTDEILRAASIAAWHSAAKHSGLVPVIQALRRHIRRSRNLPAGQVVVEREKVLFVTPSKDGKE
ncbi:NFACT RNA binding domain-containing protein [Chlorobium sp. N1]|uniref:NFACT RNA binding domain-containing protein n=1 Tax=Chlorobium sp. N1 TaxID=2491138 RepID=UPI00103C6C86|nr:NFACT RNA binding domain-containing protein [Chlorobium sp. N1]TCD47314.1 DUF814 domain-containing protein [Chlorobium sp. N1]